MVADDVKYSIERIMDPKTGSPRGAQLKNIDRIEVVDKYTVRIQMKDRDAGLLAILGLCLPSHGDRPSRGSGKTRRLLEEPRGDRSLQIC